MFRGSKLFVLIATFALLGLAAGPAAGREGAAGAVDVPENLMAPDGSVLVFTLAARGDQIYTCEADPDDAASFVWTFTAPEAELLNARGEVVGTHFAGPTWQGLDGGAVVGAVLERTDAPDLRAIPWLLLEATSHEGSGVFSTVTHIQRLATAGGVAPADGCDEAHAGAETRSPYEAIYAFFYPAAAAAATGAGTVTVSVFSCPEEISQTTGEEPTAVETLLAECEPLTAAEAVPNLRALPDGEPMTGVETGPGVYRWEGLAFADYAVGNAAPGPHLGALLVTNTDGDAMQNPVVMLNESTPDAEVRFFYFPVAATPAA